MHESPSNISRPQSEQIIASTSLAALIHVRADSSIEVRRLRVGWFPRGEVLLRSIPPGSATEIASEIGYSKRNAADALESLRLAGMVAVHMRGNTAHFRWSRPEFRRVLAPAPKWFPSWAPLFRVVWGLLQIDAHDRSLSRGARAVEARRIIRNLSDDVEMAGLRSPDLRVTGEEFWDEALDWASEILDALALGEPRKAFAPGRAPAY